MPLPSTFLRGVRKTRRALRCLPLLATAHLRGGLLHVMIWGSACLMTLIRRNILTATAGPEKPLLYGVPSLRCHLVVRIRGPGNLLSHIRIGRRCSTSPCPSCPHMDDIKSIATCLWENASRAQAGSGIECDGSRLRIPRAAGANKTPGGGGARPVAPRTSRNSCRVLRVQPTSGEPSHSSPLPLRSAFETRQMA